MPFVWITICCSTLGYLETLPLSQEEVRRADAKLLKKQEEAGRYRRLKTSLYESLTDGLVSKEEYLELKAVYDAKLQEAQEALAVLEGELESLLHGRSANAEWIACFKQHKNITKLTRRIAVSLIERIEVHEGSRITIHFRYQDSYERMAGMIKNIGLMQPPEDAPIGKGAV